MVGASGAIYGLLLAHGLLFADRPIYMYLLFPVRDEVVRDHHGRGGAVVVDQRSGSGGTAHLAHLGGMVVGYFYLTRGRGGPWAEIKYRYTKWRMNRLRRRFDVHDGGRGSRGGFGGPSDRGRPPGGWTHSIHATDRPIARYTHIDGIES